MITATKTKALRINSSRKAAQFTSAASAITTEQAARMVQILAAGRYERATKAFRGFEMSLDALGDGADPGLDLYAEILCSEFNDAEVALIDALLAPQHEGDLTAGRYHLTVHHAAELIHEGRVFRAVPDPTQDLEFGEAGYYGPAMILIIEDEPASNRTRG